MCSLQKCSTPFARQCLVTAGVSLSAMEHSLVIGFTAILLPQIRQDPAFEVDDGSLSWIASIIGIANIVGTFFLPFIAYKLGRRIANLISAITMTIGWLCIALANSANLLLIARFIQGIALGISNLSSILVGEYTTPRYRGAFLTMMMAALLTGGLLVHAIGSSLTWHQTAIFCLCIAVTDAILISVSPESPVFLASRGRYDECRNVFHWLRGFQEEEELEAMIRTQMHNRALHKTFMQNERIMKRAIKRFKRIFSILIKPEFYKPLILMFHLDICNMWCGTILMDAFGVDVFHLLIGKNVNIFLMMLTMDISRILSTMTAVFLNTKFKRRTMMMTFFSLNILVIFITALYSYCKDTKILPFDHPFVGAGLVYLLMVVSGGGTAPIVNIVSAEIFPWRYKTACTLFSTLFLSFNVTIVLKSTPYLMSNLNLYGAYCVYGLICAYGTLMAIVMLPETKDRTLQNIEEEFWKTKSQIPLESNVRELESKKMIA